MEINQHVSHFQHGEGRILEILNDGADARVEFESGKVALISTDNLTSTDPKPAEDPKPKRKPIDTNNSMMYKGAVVTILEQGTALAKVRDADGNEFSVKSDDLVSYKPIEASGTYGEFAAMLQRRGYSLTAELHDEDEYDPTLEEYTEWAGESMPEDCIKIYPNRPGTVFWREWCLDFKYDRDMEIPFDLVREGTGGGGKGTARKPVGIIHMNNHVTVRYSSIVEALIRAGLRAQKGK